MKSTDNILAESENYLVTNEFEVVNLDFKSVNKSTVCIGDFYGDPQCAIISRNEQYAVVGGTGFIVYFLQKPFSPYKYNTVSKQYFERGREPQQIVSVSNLYQEETDGDMFFRYEAKTNECTEVWRVNVESRTGELMEINNSG